MHSVTFNFLLSTLLWSLLQPSVIFVAASHLEVIPGQTFQRKSERPHWVHRMRYKYGDHRPHFGYHEGHLASEHQHKSRPVYPPITDLWKPWVPGKLIWSNKTKEADGAKETNGKAVNTRSGAPLTDFVVQIYEGDKHLCGGTIINENTVVTSSTCFIEAKPKKLTVRANDGKEYEAVSGDNGNDFDFGAGKKLVTFLKLTSNVPSDMANLAPKLCDKALELDASVKFVKWSGNVTNVHTVKTSLLNLADCRQLYSDVDSHLIKDNTICVINQNKQDGCIKTFGMPLFSHSMLCGINIMGHNCPKPLGADVFVYVFNTEELLESQVEFLQRSGLANVLS